MKLKQIWSSNIYTLRSNLRFFNTLVKPVLLYGSETWKINEGDNRKLGTFFFKCLRRILQIRWPYVVSNRDILTKTKLKTISTEVKLRRWKWVGHILRMEKNSNCETALTCPYKKQPMVYHCVPLNTIEYNRIPSTTIEACNGKLVGLNGTLHGISRYHSLPLKDHKVPFDTIGAFSDTGYYWLVSMVS